MAESSVQFSATMVGDDAVAYKLNKLQKELVQVTAENSRLKASAAGIGDGFDRSFASLKRFAEATKEAGKSPFEKYQSDLSRIQQAVKAGLLTQDEAVAARRRLTEALDKNSDAYRAQQAELNRLDTIANRVKESQVTGAQRTQRHLADVKKAYESGKLSAEEYRREVEKAHAPTSGLADGASRMIGDWRGAFAGMIGGVTSVTAAVMFAIDAAKQAAEEAKQLRGEQKQTQLTVGEAQYEVRKMIGDKKAAPFIAQVDAVAEKSKFGNRAAAMQAGANLLSATGGDEERSLSALQWALKIQRNRPDAVGAFAGAIADFSKFADVKDAKGMKRVAALANSAIGQARPEAMENLSEATGAMATANAASTAQDRMKSLEQTTGLWAGISQVITDKGGAQTKTATAGVIALLEKIAPEKTQTITLEDWQVAELTAKRLSLQHKLDTVRRQQETETPERIDLQRKALDAEIADLDKQVATKRHTGGRHMPLTAEDLAKAQLRRDELATRRERIGTGRPAKEFEVQAAALQADIDKIDQKLTGEVREGTGLKDTYARLQAVWNNPKLAAEFKERAEKGGFRAAVKGAIKSLGDKDSLASKTVRNAIGNITSQEDALDRLVSDLETETPQMQMVTREGEAKARIETFDLNATEAGRRGQVEKLVDDVLLRTRTTDRGLMAGANARIDETLPFVGIKDTFSRSVRGGMAPEQAGIQALTRRAKLFGGLGESGQPLKSPEQLTVGDREKLEYHLSMVKMLRQWTTEQPAQTATAELPAREQPANPIVQPRLATEPPRVAAAGEPAADGLPRTSPAAPMTQEQPLIGERPAPAPVAQDQPLVRERIQPPPAAGDQPLTRSPAAQRPEEPTMRLPSTAAVTAPPADEPRQTVGDPQVVAELEQMRRVMTAMQLATERGANASERLASVASGPGASTIAAQPSIHRQPR